MRSFNVLATERKFGGGFGVHSSENREILYTDDQGVLISFALETGCRQQMPT